MPEPIVLYEHQPKHRTGIRTDKLSPADRDVLRWMQDEDYIELPINLEQQHQLEIKPKQFVGSVELEDAGRKINIVPKIFKDEDYWKLTNILLDFAHDGELDYFDDAKNFFLESAEPVLLNRVHLGLISEFDKLWKQGLLKSYVVHAEDSTSMRGKLLMREQMLNDAMLRPKFFCEFDELEYDSVENRVILQALTVVERTSDQQVTRMKALDSAQRLSAVVQQVEVRGPERQRMMQSYNRQNERYRKIHERCEQVIQESGIDDIYRGDISHVPPVFYDMNKEFESFVEKLFEKYYDKTKGIPEFQKEEAAWTKSAGGPRKMKPDIIIKKGTDVLHIIDVKYKTDKPGLSTGDLYQLGFYIHEYGSKTPEDSRVKCAFAILPSSESVKEDTYTATRTNVKVHVKCLDVKKCLELIQVNDQASDDELRKIVAGLLDPPTNAVTPSPHF